VNKSIKKSSSIYGLFLDHIAETNGLDKEAMIEGNTNNDK